MRLSIGLIPALTLFALTLTLLGPVQAGWRANHAKSTRNTIHGVDIRVERIERTVHHGPRRNDRYARHRSVEKRDWHDVLVEKEREQGGREGVGLDRRAAEGTCVLGAWRCSGQELQRCFNGGYNKIQVCDGQKTICAADNPSTPPGCIWANAGVQMVGPSAPVPVPLPNPSIGPTSVYHPPGVSPSPSAGLPPVVVPSPSGGGQLPPVVPSPSGGLPIPSPSGVPSPSGQGSPGPVVSGTPPTKEYKAPHWVAYLDLVHTPMPSAAELLPANRFVLAFWLTQCPDTGTFGPYDWSKKWLDLPLSERTAVLEDYHSNGIALMVTAFGSTDFPMALNVDPVECAVELAKYVKQAGLDGVDVDYEDSGSIQAGGGEAWLITFQTELRRQLPKPYIISHAPQPLYFLESWAPKGGYKTVHAAVGSGIDFYNVQYYNQGTSYPYTDCASMLTAGFQATSASEINHSAGVPMNKMVIGKPLLPKYVYNTGMMEGPAFGQCMKQGLGLGVGGAMIWQWDVGGQEFMKAVVGSGSNSTA